jgi:hypothetical protein
MQDSTDAQAVRNWDAAIPEVRESHVPCIFHAVSIFRRGTHHPLSLDVLARLSSDAATLFVYHRAEHLVLQQTH